MSIKAIETTYAGCRFRSRLEARWAVFFDAVKLRWRYEPQGFEIPQLAGESGRYLPDFYLTDLGCWCEVKGELTHDELVQLVLAAAKSGLPATPEGGAVLGWPWAARILILGDVPANEEWAHMRLDLVGEDLVVAQTVVFTRTSLGVRPVEIGRGWPLNQLLIDREEPRLSIINHGMPCLFVPEDPLIAKAYIAARQSRFEHGESGAP